MPAGSVLLVTDTNRRQGMRWAGMRNNYGYTEQAGEQPLRSDLLDQRLEIYPGVTDRARTVVELRGMKSVRATTYGTPAFGFTPDAGRAMRSTATASPHGKSPRGSRRSVGNDSSPSSSTR